MTDKMRHEYRDAGEVDRQDVFAAVDAETVIELSDLLWQDVGKVLPASSLTAEMVGMAVDVPARNVNLQDAFGHRFLGVAMEGSRSGEVRLPGWRGGDTAPVRVATAGLFEFDCPSGTFELGELVGVYCLRCDVPGLANQMVEKVTDPKVAIGCVARYEHEPTTAVLVEIRSKVMGR